MDGVALRSTSSRRFFGILFAMTLLLFVSALLAPDSRNSISEFGLEGSITGNDFINVNAFPVGTLSCTAESDIPLSRQEAESLALKEANGTSGVRGSGLGCSVHGRPLSSAPVWIVSLEPDSVEFFCSSMRLVASHQDCVADRAIARVNATSGAIENLYIKGDGFVFTRVVSH